eukprot:3784582-Pleurochrysis_carterae.AAC.1
MSLPMKTMPLMIGEKNGHGDVKRFAQCVCLAARDSSVDAQDRGVWGRMYVCGAVSSSESLRAVL